MQLNMDLGDVSRDGNVLHEMMNKLMQTTVGISASVAPLFREYGLTEAQFNVLRLLRYKDKDLTQTDLGGLLNITRASTTSVLDKMEDKGLILRKSVPGNRRIYHVDLKTDGLTLVESVEPLYLEVVNRVMSALDDDECRVLADYLERIRMKAGEIADEQRAVR